MKLTRFTACSRFAHTRPHPFRVAASRPAAARRGPRHQGPESRSGGTKRPYFEGGQLPLVRRLPHLGGFTNIWRVEYGRSTWSG